MVTNKIIYYWLLEAFMKRNFSFLFFIPLFLSHLSYASEDIVGLAKKALVLNETSNDYAVKKEVAEKFSDIKEYIQSDLKNGNRNVRVDIYLLLDGLIQNNLLSLQSFLATNKNDVFTKEFSDNITYDYAEKLAYALKENKRLLTTEYIIEDTRQKTKCVNYVNGYKLSNNKSFIAPAGLPYYVATYCMDNTFAVAKVQSENAQPKYVISLSDFQENTYVSLPEKEAPVLDQVAPSKPHANSQTVIVTPSVVEEKSFMEQSQRKFIVSSGVGINSFFGNTKNENISTMDLDCGTIIYSTSGIQYDIYYFSFDFAPISRATKTVHRDIVKTSSNSTGDGPTTITTKVTTTYKPVTQDGYFIRPNFGANVPVYSFQESVIFSLAGFANLTILQTSGENPYSSVSPGLGIMPNISVDMGHNFLFNLGLQAGVDFPAGAQFEIGANSTIGYMF
jgi:hypothetical protein